MTTQALANAQIKLNTTMAHIGSILKIEVINALLPPYKDTLVYVGGVSARITSHNTSTVYAIIPVGVDSGEQNVFVFDRKLNMSSAAQKLIVKYENVIFDEETTQKYATRFAANPLKTISVYSRDLAYTNYTEINDATSIMQNVLSIILTRHGERFFNPNFGTRVMDALFSLISQPSVLEKELMLEIKTQVEYYEPRAKIHADKSFVVFNDESNALYVIVVVEVPGGSTKELGITLSTVRKV